MVNSFCARNFSRVPVIRDGRSGCPGLEYSVQCSSVITFMAILLKFLTTTRSPRQNPRPSPRHFPREPANIFRSPRPAAFLPDRAGPPLPQKLASLVGDQLRRSYALLIGA